jgi:hypothetical protein
MEFGSNPDFGSPERTRTYVRKPKSELETLVKDMSPDSPMDLAHIAGKSGLQ